AERLKPYGERLGANSVLSCEPMKKVVIQEVDVLLVRQIPFEKLPWHQQRGGEIIGLLFRFIGALARHIASQSNPELVINVQLLLIMKQKMSEFVSDREMLPCRRMAGINANDSLGL